MIPAEAVEAAAKAAYGLKPVELFGREYPITWEQLSDSPLGQRCKDNELASARAALEAAAPHMLADAWEAGYGHGYKHGYADCLKLYGHDTKEEA